MIISPRHGFVFVKGVKVGGTSVELFLSQALDDRAIVAPSNFGNSAFQARNYRDEASGRELTNHATAAEAKAFLGDACFDSMRRALIVRNPFEKLRSFLYFKMAKGFVDMTLDQAIETCSSEAVRALDGHGQNLITDILFYERLDIDLAAFFGRVGLAFGGRLDLFEKSAPRRAFGHIPVVFEPTHEDAVRRKFAFDFRCYDRAGLAAPRDP